MYIITNNNENKLKQFFLKGGWGGEGEEDKILKFLKKCSFIHQHLLPTSQQVT